MQQESGAESLSEILQSIWVAGSGNHSSWKHKRDSQSTLAKADVAKPVTPDLKQNAFFIS